MNKTPVIFTTKLEKIDNDYILEIRSLKNKKSFQKRYNFLVNVLDETIKILMSNNYYIVKYQKSKNNNFRITTLKG